MLQSRHLISTADLSKKEVDDLVHRIKSLAEFPVKDGLPRSVEDRRVGFLFYGKRSRRTFDSFVMAVQDLGWQYAGGMGAEDFSGMVGGESLEHAAYFYGSRCNAIVMRHPTSSAQNSASKYSAVPVLSAGGSKEGEHPTQALGDFVLLRSLLGGCGGKEVAFVGNLLDSSSVHSLCHLLRHEMPKRVYVVSPEGQGLPVEYKAVLSDVVEEGSVAHLPKSVKAIYLVQSPGAEDAKRYQVSKDILSHLGNVRVLHPLPAGPELAEDAASDARVVVRGQMDYAHFARMACLDFLIGARTFK